MATPAGRRLALAAYRPAEPAKSRWMDYWGLFTLKNSPATVSGAVAGA
jgi:hypothetical protein